MIKKMIRRTLSFASILAVGACANEPTAPVLDDIEASFASLTAAKCLALAQRLDAHNARIGDRTASDIVEVTDGLTTTTEYQGAAWTAQVRKRNAIVIVRTFTKDGAGNVVSASWLTREKKNRRGEGRRIHTPRDFVCL